MAPKNFPLVLDFPYWQRKSGALISEGEAKKIAERGRELEAALSPGSKNSLHSVVERRSPPNGFITFRKKSRESPDSH
jgi:hypothetical protein